MKSSSATYDLLIACCSIKTDVDRFNANICRIKDWDSFLNSSNIHGVLPLVYRKLKDKKTCIDKSTFNKLKLSYLSIAQNNMVICSELTKMFKLFNDSHITAIAIKGPTLSKLLYDDITIRQYSDLDILVDEQSLYDAANILLQNNYTIKYPVKFLKNKNFLTTTKDIEFYNENSNVVIELHWKLFEYDPMEQNSLYFNNSNSITINTQDIKTFNNEILISYLCIHGSKHLWERLEWVVDVDRLIRKSTYIDWNFIQKHVNSMRERYRFYAGLAVVNNLFNTPLPQQIFTSLSEEKDIPIFVIKVTTSLKTNIINAHSSVSTKKEESFNASQSEKFRLLSRDVLRVNLPNYLSFFYYILPILRKLRKALLKIKS